MFGQKNVDAWTQDNSNLEKQNGSTYQNYTFMSSVSCTHTDIYVCLKAFDKRYMEK